MPGVKIPIYQQQTNLQDGAPAPDAPMVVPTNNVGTAIQGLGEAGSTFAGVQALVQRDAAATESARVTSQVGLQLNQMKNDALSNAPVGGYGLTDGFNQKFNDLRTQTLENVTDPYAKKYLNTYFDHQSEVYGSAMQNQETTMRAKYIADNIGTAGDNVARTVSQDPTQFNAALAPVLGSINSLEGIGGDMKLALTKKVTEQAAYAAGLRTASDNPQGFLNAVNTPMDQAPPTGFDWIRSIDPQKTNLLQNHAQTLIAQQQNATDRDLQVRTNAAITARNTAIDIWTNGRQISPDYANQLLQTAAGTSEEAPMKEFIAYAGKTAGFSSLSLGAQQAQIDQLNTKATTPGQGVDDIESKYLTQIQQLHSKAVTDYKDDAWSAASDRGVIHNLNIEPITDENSALAVIKARAPTIGTVEDAAGRPVSPLQPVEASQLSRYLQTLPAEQRGQVVNDIGSAIGNTGRIGALADQLGTTSKVDRAALLVGANNAMGENGKYMASMVYDGAQYIHDKRAGIDDKLVEGITSQIASKVRDSLPTGVAEDDAINTAKYLYAYNAVKGGLSNQSVDSGAVDTAINGAMGSVTSLNGRQTAMPRGWDEDRFTTAVKSVGPSNLVTAPADGQVHVGRTSMPVADFLKSVPSAKLMRVAENGTYAVMAGTGYATSSDKQPILIRLK